MPRIDYDSYSIHRSRTRRMKSAQDRAIDLQLSLIATGVIVFAIACAIYGAYWG